MPKGVFHWLPWILDRSQGAAMQWGMQQLLKTSWGDAVEGVEMLCQPE